MIFFYWKLVLFLQNISWLLFLLLVSPLSPLQFGSISSTEWEMRVQFESFGDAPFLFVCLFVFATCLFLCQCLGHCCSTVVLDIRYCDISSFYLPRISGVLWFHMDSRVITPSSLKNVTDILIASRRDIKRILILPIYKHEKPVYFQWLLTYISSVSCYRYWVFPVLSTVYSSWLALAAVHRVI